MTTKHILIDGRELLPNKKTGIGRVLEGFLDALADVDSDIEIVLASICMDSIPYRLQNREKIRIWKISSDFLLSEAALSKLSKQKFSLYISPYPKLPLFGCYCKSVNTVHDIFDLTHSAYRKRMKVTFDKFRLKKALKRADLTWYDSSWSKEETIKLVGFAGENPRVRFPGIGEGFSYEKRLNEKDAIKKYQLKPGYILVIGNGLPHKNLGLLLSISDQISRELVFVGVSQTNQKYWKVRYPHSQAIWIEYVRDENLPVIMKNAFCLAQPSKEEGYGYPPLEAMACGVPAVVSHISVLVETTGGNALVANPEDSRAWVEAFDKLEDQSVRQTYIEKGLKWVKPLQGREGWKNHIADIEEVIEGNK